MLAFVPLVFALAAPALAAVSPNSPNAATVVKVGENIDAMWVADTTGQWKNTTIQLMTGANLNMVPLATIAYGIDGTANTKFSFPAPDVEPYSKIYFLQFTNGGDISTSTWTTRFTIAGADGSTTEPTETDNSNGQAVQWGTGKLKGAAPATVTDGSGASAEGDSAAPTSAPSASAASASDAAAAVTSAPAESAAASDASSASAAATPSAESSAAGSARSSGTAAAAAASSSPAGGASKSSVGLGAVVLAIAGFFAL